MASLGSRIAATILVIVFWFAFHSFVPCIFRRRIGLVAESSRVPGIGSHCDWAGCSLLG